MNLYLKYAREHWALVDENRSDSLFRTRRRGRALYSEAPCENRGLGFAQLFLFGIPHRPDGSSVRRPERQPTQIRTHGTQFPGCLAG